MARITGAYVSGLYNRMGHVQPAMINESQNIQRHETTAMNPDMMGPRIGPNVVACGRD